METVNLTLDRGEARQLWRKYREHLHYSQPIDHEIMRAYQLIAQGRLIIKAIESIAKAGRRESDGFPKLAIARATAEACFLTLRGDGSATMASRDDGWGGARRNERPNTRITLPAGSFTGLKPSGNWRAQALVPPVPLHLKPARGLDNYHVLWEAEWQKVPPRDPYLLRRIGEGDMWLVVAMWNLTEVERAALASRI